MVFRPELSWEFLSADEITAKGIRAVRNHVRHVKEASPYYRETLSQVEPDDLQAPEDISKLPCTDKQAVARRTRDFRAVSLEHIVETVVTSGSTGRELMVSLTASDLDRLAFNEALSFHGAGVAGSDTAHIFTSLDRLFIAGMAYYRGLSELGVNTCRIGVLPPRMQMHYLRLLPPTVIVGVPSFLRKLAHQLNDEGFDTRTAGITRIFCIGESLRSRDMSLNALGNSLEELYRAQVFSTYGQTELQVAYCECTARHGGHAHPELVYTEIVDEQGRPVADGTPGELVATPLGVEGMPLLRYRTGDITFKISETCACGRNSCRIGPILARKAQLIKWEGTSVYPPAITNALDEFDEIEDYVIELKSDSTQSDSVAVHAAVAPDMVPSISERVRANARVTIPILVSNAKTIESLRGAGRKKVKVVDLRKSPGSVGSATPATPDPSA